MISNCYQKSKERLQKELHERYQNLSEEKKVKMQKKKLETDIKIFLKKSIK